MLKNLLKFFSKKQVDLKMTLDTLVELDLITKEEMLLLKKERAIKEWENETKEPAKGRRKTK